jgi:hypothetical protein
MDLKTPACGLTGRPNRQPRFPDAMDFLNFREDPFKVRARMPGRAMRSLSQEIEAIADRENGFCKG